MVSALATRVSGPGRALAEDIVLCSWARQFTLTVPLSTQVYKWVLANLLLEGNPAMSRNTLSHFMLLKHGDKGRLVSCLS